MKFLSPMLILLAFASQGWAQQEDNALVKARQLLKAQKNAEAITVLLALRARRPELKGANRELGVAYYRESDFLEAAQYLQEAWTEDPGDRDAVQLLGLSYYSSGRPTQAIPALEQVRAWYPGKNIDAIYILGICYALAGRYTDARVTFAQLFGEKVESSAAHLITGRMLLRQGLDVAAEGEIKAALLISPQLPLAHLSLGEVHLFGGRYTEASDEFQAELRVNPACAIAMTHLGETFWRLKRDEESQRVSLRAISLEDTEAEPFVVLGKAQIRQGQWGLAEKNLRRALQLDHENYTAHFLLAQLYRDQGLIEASKREMEAAARIQRAVQRSASRN